MRLFLSLVAGLALAPSHAVRAEIPWRLESTKNLATHSSAVTHRVLTLHNDRALEVHLVRFERNRATLRVLDLAPGMTVADAVEAHGGLAGVNGGYFKPDHTPLGLVVSKGDTLHAWERSKILTGVLAVTPRGASLLRAAEFKPGPGIREALQAGPFLVDRGRAVAGLNATRLAERTVLLAESKGVVALLTTAPVSLAELSQLLATPGLWAGLKIERALNLDGGSSTALWVAAEPAAYSRPEWKPVRNAVAILPAGKTL